MRPVPNIRTRLDETVHCRDVHELLDSARAEQGTVPVELVRRLEDCRLLQRVARDREPEPRNHAIQPEPTSDRIQL